MKARLLTCVLLLTAAVSAQTFRGTILGNSHRLPVAQLCRVHRSPSANANTGLERITLTSADGSYSVPELPIGSYDVTVKQKKAFQTAVTKGVQVDCSVGPARGRCLEAGRG